MAEIYHLNENNTYKLTFNLVNENDDAITLSVLDTFQLTLYYYNSSLGNSDRYHLATINSRYNQNIKNANNVTVSSQGAVTWVIQPEDNIKLNSDLEEELHVATFSWTYDSSTKKNNKEIFLYVKDIPYAL